VAELVIAAAVKGGPSLVIDADGLWVLTHNLSIVKGFDRCILTPNAVEFERIREKMIETSTSSSFGEGVLEDLLSTDVQTQVAAVSRALVTACAMTSHCI